MKIVHISTTDFGGAYRAAANISRAMCMCGADSKVIVREKHSAENVIPFCNTSAKLLVSKTKNFFNLMASRGEIINDMFGSDITSMREILEADVIILHWVNSFVSYEGVRRICSLGKPVFWVMHDMWCFTGGCHLDYGCGKYADCCGMCPLLKSRSEGDLSSEIIKRKKSEWVSADFSLIGPSKYMSEAARISMLMKNRNVINIPNPVDTDIYLSRKHSNNKKKMILFGALSPREYWKGMDLLIGALKCLSPSLYKVVICGRTDGVENVNIMQEIEMTGLIASKEKMAELYDMADVFVIPSRQENLSNAVLESLSCGTPVAAFNIGGMSDMIEHKADGYLAKPFDTEDLATGIEYCASRKSEMGAAARQKIEKEFSMRVIGERYVRLCSEACDHHYPEGEYVF